MAILKETNTHAYCLLLYFSLLSDDEGSSGNDDDTDEDDSCLDNPVFSPSDSRERVIVQFVVSLKYMMCYSSHPPISHPPPSPSLSHLSDLSQFQ